MGCKAMTASDLRQMRAEVTASAIVAARSTPSFSPLFLALVICSFVGARRRSAAKILEVVSERSKGQISANLNPADKIESPSLRAVSSSCLHANSLYLAT